jgi:hypothetical protein
MLVDEFNVRHGSSASQLELEHRLSHFNFMTEGKRHHIIILARPIELRVDGITKPGKQARALAADGVDERGIEGAKEKILMLRARKYPMIVHQLHAIGDVAAGASNVTRRLI